MEAFKFNTALASADEVQQLSGQGQGYGASYGTDAWTEAMRSLVLMIAPIMPHIAEELWERLGGAYSVHTQRWPEWDPELWRPMR